MGKDAIYEGSRDVRVFYYLALGANVLLRKSKEDEKGSNYTIMGSLLLSAFTFEAYLNHVGEKKIRHWAEIEFIRVMKKYRVICKEFEIAPDFSKRPYKTLTELFKFRNAIAHGRSQILEETKEVSSNCDPHECAPNPTTQFKI